MSRRFIYRRMTGPEIAGALDRLQMPPKAFARIFGMDARRLARVLADEPGADAPPWIPIALALLSLPGALGLARQIAAEHITEDRQTGEIEPFLEKEP